MHQFGKHCYENLAPFSKSETETPQLVSSNFGFNFEIKLVACLKYGI
jgi:hypothetical protein